jgi:hypothetical protein
MRARYLSIIMFLATCGWALTAAAQAPDFARDQPGRWAITDRGTVVKFVAPSESIDLPIRFPAVVSSTERPLVQAWVNQLVAILRRTPTLAQPHGFDVHVDIPSIDLLDLDDQPDSKRPAYVTTILRIILAPYERGPKGPVASSADAAANILFLVNRPAGVLSGTHAAGHGVTADDDGAEFLQEPVPPDETRHARPLYLGSRVDQWHVLLTRSRAPIFAPVTREQFLRSVMDTVQKQVKRPLTSMGPPPSNDPAVVAAWQEAQRQMAAIGQTYKEGIGHLQEQLDGMTKQLAAMSPGERGAATYVSNTAPGESGTIEFLRKGDDNALPVVRRNPALMDDRLPRWTPQVLVVTFEGDDGWPGLAAKLDEELDWAGLEKFLGSNGPGK